MEAFIKYLTINGKDFSPYIVLKQHPIPGELTFTDNGFIIDVNQSTCVNFPNKVLGAVNPAIQGLVKDEEVVNVGFVCSFRDECGYPFCGNKCNGNSHYYIIGKESRGY